MSSVSLCQLFRTLQHSSYLESGAVVIVPWTAQNEDQVSFGEAQTPKGRSILAKWLEWKEFEKRNEKKR